MNWECLTAPDFEKAVKETGVCILPMGVLEKHGEHLPIGTDFLVAHKISTIAAEKEPAVVFPPFYFGQINCARCFPGAVTLKPTLLIEVIEGVLDEIGRNGFKKIILYNGHGGNNNLVNLLAQFSLWEEKPYQLYIHQFGVGPKREEEKNSILETTLHGHACECETSMVLALYKDLVKMEQIPDKPGTPLNRLRDMPFTGIWWYADYPNHYAGDARPATAKKGGKLLELEVDNLAETIAAVKSDKVAPALTKEFFERVQKLRDL